MREQAIQNKIRIWLEKQGHYTFKVITANKKGIPDLITCVDGRFVAIEVKKPRGKLTELQSWNLSKINESGGVAFKATSVDEVKEMFARHGLMKGDI